MRVGLVGFGRTGRAVASVLLRQPDVELAWVVRRSQPSGCRSAGSILGVESPDPATVFGIGECSAADLFAEERVDAVIDFSSPRGIDYYAPAAAELGVSMVCAVSSFGRDVSKSFELWGRTTRALCSPNITVGINFMLLAAKALKAIAPESDVEIVEEHFRNKTETSGTALRLARTLEVDAAQVKSLRAGTIVGNHEVLFGLEDQVVRIRHESLSREAFGNGALFAARELQSRPNGVYQMEDLLLPYFTAA